MTKVGMKQQCVSIRGKTHPGERCSNRAQAGSEWCGHHKTSQVRYTAPVDDEVIELEDDTVVIPPPRKKEWQRPDIDPSVATGRIRRAWGLWLARRAGPLLWFREESNNPFDFYSSDPIEEIPLRDIISFVDGGKGYVMDIKSAVALLDHAKKNNEQPANPFNRAPLPQIFLRRMTRHRGVEPWAGLKATSEAQQLTLATTDVFRGLEDLGYYTDPTWFLDLSRLQLQQLYIELLDIWAHRASLMPADRARIVPGPRRPFPLAVPAILIMQQKALRPLVLETCKLLVSTAAARSDKQLGAMYVLGSLSVVSPGAGAAYPWLVDMFAPGVTRIHGGQLTLLHQAVMGY